ncbi:Uncharacterised protein [Mycobacteroides abscessus subsp. massiliense]|nr:hypothetical protein [Mycobacteroides abscessus]SKM18376.1 Uncharacterised protein [Mycobacteroides abscessus subsp. massiliense]MDM2426899.1 hypothetical protein [Mycobacteroides abscessus]MDM2431771.1 hypothetical protein [Mycobacteroides abscessus]MDM2436616.1 hypothetical protein [Mycobacteroides abscessus]
MSTAKEWLETQAEKLPQCHAEWSFMNAHGIVAGDDEVVGFTEANARAFTAHNSDLKLVQRTVTEWYEVQ